MVQRKMGGSRRQKQSRRRRSVHSNKHYRPHHHHSHSNRNKTSKNGLEFYSNPNIKNMKWIDFVKHIHNKNREMDKNTLLSKSLKDASVLWKKRG